MNRQLRRKGAFTLVRNHSRPIRHPCPVIIFIRHLTARARRSIAQRLRPRLTVVLSLRPLLRYFRPRSISQYRSNLFVLFFSIFFLFRACVCVCVSYRFGSATKTWPSCSGMTIGKHPSSRSTPPAHARITNSSLLRLHLTFSSNSACFSFILIRRLDQSIIFIADGILSLITSELDSLMKLTLDRCC